MSRGTRELRKRVTEPFAYRAITCYGGSFQSLRLGWCFVTLRAVRRRPSRSPATPMTQRLRAITRHRFGLIRVRSPLLTESLTCFLFLRVLRWFTSPRSLVLAYAFGRDVTRYCLAGLPHSESPGSKPACGSPRIIAACRVLRRLSAPRHPPYTLSSLTKLECLDAIGESYRL